MARVRNGVEILPKISTGSRRTNVTDRRHTANAKKSDNAVPVICLNIKYDRPIPAGSCKEKNFKFKTNVMLQILFQIGLFIEDSLGMHTHGMMATSTQASS